MGQELGNLARRVFCLDDAVHAHSTESRTSTARSFELMLGNVVAAQIRKRQGEILLADGAGTPERKTRNAVHIRLSCRLLVQRDYGSKSQDLQLLYFCGHNV